MESVATDDSHRNDRWKSPQGVAHFVTHMVAVAQLAERQVVVLDVAGSNPVGHPNARSWAARPRRLHCGRQSRL